MKTTVNKISTTLTLSSSEKFLLQVHNSGNLTIEFHGTTPQAHDCEAQLKSAWNFIADIRSGLKSGTDLDTCLANLQQEIRE